MSNFSMYSHIYCNTLRKTSRTWPCLTKHRLLQVKMCTGITLRMQVIVHLSPVLRCMLGQTLQTLLVITFIAQVASLFIVILITEKKNNQPSKLDELKDFKSTLFAYCSHFNFLTLYVLGL